MKVLIGIPSVDYIHYKFAESLSKLILKMKTDNIDVDVKFQGDTNVHLGRDAIVTAAINGGYSHVLWLDADMVFDDDIFEKLSSSEKDFISGICHARRPPFRSCLFKSLTPLVNRYDNTYPKEIFEVGGCGFGCVLIKTSILEAVKRKHQQPFLPSLAFGEDLMFCVRAKELGYKIFANPDVVIGHISQKVIYSEDYLGE